MPVNTDLIDSEAKKAHDLTEAAKASLASLGGQGFGYTATVTSVASDIKAAVSAWEKVKSMCAGAMAQLTPDEIQNTGLPHFLNTRIQVASVELDSLDQVKAGLQSYILSHIAPFAPAATPGGLLPTGPDGRPILPSGFGLPSMPSSIPLAPAGGPPGPAQRTPLPGTVPTSPGGGLVPPTLAGESETPWTLYALGAGAVYLAYRLIF